MVNHIVMWTLKDEHNGMNKHEIALKIKQQLMTLVNEIPEIISFEVGVNAFFHEKNHDVVLISKFENLESLQTYAKHPKHQKVVGFIKEVITGRSAVDFES